MRQNAQHSTHPHLEAPLMKRHLLQPWTILALCFAAMGAAWPAARFLTTSRGAKAAPVSGDTLIVYGPRQLAGSSGQGQTYVERFTVTSPGGRLYTLHLVNGNASGGQRAS